MKINFWAPQQPNFTSVIWFSVWNKVTAWEEFTTVFAWTPTNPLPPHPWLYPSQPSHLPPKGLCPGWDCSPVVMSPCCQYSPKVNIGNLIISLFFDICHCRWDTSAGGLTFSDQFLQISTHLPTNHIYGFGENVHNSLKHDTNFRSWPMWARDEPPGTDVRKPICWN